MAHLKKSYILIFRPFKKPESLKTYLVFNTYANFLRNMEQAGHGIHLDHDYHSYQKETFYSHTLMKTSTLYGFPPKPVHLLNWSLKIQCSVILVYRINFSVIATNALKRKGERPAFFIRHNDVGDEGNITLIPCYYFVWDVLSSSS